MPLTQFIFRTCKKVLRTPWRVYKKVYFKLRFKIYSRKIRTQGLETYDEAESIDVVLYFPDKRVNLYQLRQWYAPLEELSKSVSVAILLRHPITFFEVSRETDLRLLYIGSMSRYESFCRSCQPKLLLYVNHNRANLSSMQIRSALTVYLCHGESEKPYMTWGQVRAYDFHLIAGKAAYNRLSRAMPNYDVEKRAIIIGRPQADAITPQLSSSPTTTVLYAPTREGDRDSMALSSVLALGPSLVQALLSKGVRVIYRPHPCLGSNKKAYRLAHQEIVSLINQHNKTVEHPSFFSVYDSSPEVGWQIKCSDYCIVDLSAFGLDYLASLKPIVLLLPPDYELPPEEVCYAQATYVVHHDETDKLQDLIELLPRQDHLKDIRSSVSHYYYDGIGKQSSTARFIRAIQSLLSYQKSEQDRLSSIRKLPLGNTISEPRL